MQRWGDPKKMVRSAPRPASGVSVCFCAKTQVCLRQLDVVDLLYSNVSNGVCIVMEHAGWRGSAVVFRTGCSATTDAAFLRAKCVTGTRTVSTQDMLTTTPMNETADVRYVYCSSLWSIRHLCRKFGTNGRTDIPTEKVAKTQLQRHS